MADVIVVQVSMWRLSVVRATVPVLAAAVRLRLCNMERAAAVIGRMTKWAVQGMRVLPVSGGGDVV